MSGERELRVIGLLSGTSMDGVDAALVAVRGSGASLRARLLAFRTTAFTGADRKRLGAAAGIGRREAAEAARLDVRAGEIFAGAAIRLASRHGGIGRVDLIGSHGQTILHLPGGREAATVQIGSGAVIAARTGAPVVHDFRAADVASGGEGAPLLPITDYLLFRSARTDRVILNIGGIANITVLPAGAPWEGTLAYDTGPGNALIDRIASTLTKGRSPCDRNGRGAARGRAVPAILETLLDHPFLYERPPRSTGTETFGDALAAAIVRKGRRLRATGNDLLATATLFTARTAGSEIRQRTGPSAVVYVSGGGAHNRTLLGMLAEEVAPRRVLPLDALGVSPDAREAVGFALLASEFVRGARYAMRAVTGARGAAPLGCFSPGARPYHLDLDRGK
jgi:anhydro-N-acetylmuramic acid kinase